MASASERTPLLTSSKSAKSAGVSSDAIRKLQAKASKIQWLLMQPTVDLWALREMALSEGGLVNDTLRRRAWPKLVGLHKYNDDELELNTTNGSGNDTITLMTPLKSRPLHASPSQSDFVEIDASLVLSLDAAAMESEDQFDVGVTPNSRHSGKSFHSTSNHNANKLVVESMDVEQIDRDVARCTWHLLTGSQRSRRIQYANKDRKKVSSLLKKKQRRLANLINLTLVSTSYFDSAEENQHMRYYQGYHDVACIFLSTLGGGNAAPSRTPTAAAAAPIRSPTGQMSRQELSTKAVSMGLDLPSRVLGQVSHSHFRDSLKTDFMQLQTAIRLALFPLLFALDPQVHNHLYDCDMEPFFCLSWIITWFAHDVRDTQVVKRLFDAFLVSHPLLPVYMTIAMMLHPVNRQEVLDTDCDFAAVHQCLAGLPRNSCRVGWKRRPGGEGGYVSDDENDNNSNNSLVMVDDERTVSTDLDASVLSEEFSGIISNNSDLVDADSTDDKSTSVMSGTSIGPIGVLPDRTELVPFQDLLDSALSYMRRYPPRSLIPLATRYFRGDTLPAAMAAELPHITILKPHPPSWAIVATAWSDWVLKQRARSAQGLPKSSRKDRRRRRRTPKGKSLEIDDAPMIPKPNDSVGRVDNRYLRRKQRSKAVVAVGHGPLGAEEDQRRRKRQTVILWCSAAVLVAAVAVSVGLYVQQQNNEGAIVANETASETMAPVLSRRRTERQNTEPKTPMFHKPAPEIPAEKPKSKPMFFHAPSPKPVTPPEPKPRFFHNPKPIPAPKEEPKPEPLPVFLPKPAPHNESKSEPELKPHPLPRPTPHEKPKPKPVPEQNRKEEAQIAVVTTAANDDETLVQRIYESLTTRSNNDNVAEKEGSSSASDRNAGAIAHPPNPLIMGRLIKRVERFWKAVFNIFRRRRRQKS